MASVDVRVNDLKDRYEGDLYARFTDTYLQVKIADAEGLIAGDLPTVAGRLASGALSDTNYKRIVVGMVLRVIRNPEGYVSESEGGVGLSRNPTVASGDLWLTDNDIATLTGVKPRAGRTLPGSVSIGLDPGWGS